MVSAQPFNQRGIQMRVMRSLLVAFGIGVGCLHAAAQPAPVPVEIWADTLQVTDLDMSPDAQRMAMLMRRERGADPELLLFETKDIGGTLVAIQPDGLIPTAVSWASDEYLVVNFVLETEDKGRPVYLSRSASYNSKTGEWTSLIRTTTKRDVRNSGKNLMNELGIGQVVSILADDPDHVLISHNEEAGKSANYYRVNLKTGQRSLVLRGNERFDGYVWDRQGNARGAAEYDAAQNAIVFMARESADNEWKEVGRRRADSRDRFDLLGFFDPQRPYMATVVADEPGGNYTAVFDIDIRNGKRDMVFGTTTFDSVGVIRSPRLAEGTKVVGYSYADLEGEQHYYIDETYGALYENLKQVFQGRSVDIQRVSDDGKTILVRTTGPQDPGSWYLVRDGQVAPVITATTEIPEEALSPSETITYKARDGLEISGYLTTPANMEGPFPTIVMPHGGPWVRDTYGYDEWAQMLANQGYAVLQPNYRGSTELGKSFWMAGDNQWGHKMQDDVEDGVKALIDRGVADPDKLAIFGWSYGGYSAFAAATRDDSMFNCVVAGAGVSDLTRIRGGISGSRFLRQYQKPTISGVSPIDLVSKVERPMLIVHGDYDQTVPVEHSRRFVDGLKAINADHQYIEIKNMGHSPIFYEQNMQWYPQLLEFFDTKCGF